ncbi:uncharacterized protein LOC135808374 [Sycon ciliatum]|uniref:uncharacterized protein LOC135808374 n=1 Tax=Sycon ciliatum TaxID=27933 RepID=UPI0031F6DF84
MLSRLILLLALASPLITAQPHPHPRPISLEGCGHTKGCFAMPEGCHLGPRGHEECDGVYTQEVEPHNPLNVRIQLYGRTVAGWIAVGFNSKQHMDGTDVIACQATPEGHIQVKNLHNVNHTNHMDDLTNVAPYLYDASGMLHNGSITCQADRPLVTENEKFDVNLNVPHYILFAWNFNGSAPANGPLMHMHQAMPVISNHTLSAHTIFFNNITEKSVDLSTCGKTKGCSRAPAGCQSAEECYYVFTQQVSQHDSSMVEFELTGYVHGWVAMGYNFNYTMNGTDVVGCQITPEMDRVAVKKLHNVNHTNLVDGKDTQHGLMRPEGRFVDERIHCRWARSIKPIEGDAFSRDLSLSSYIILAGNVNATAPANEALGHMHSYPPMILPDMHTAMDHTFNYNVSADSPDSPLDTSALYEHAERAEEPAPVQTPLAIDLSGCGKTKACSRAPAGCESADDCIYVFTMSADNAGDTVTFELSAVAAGWIAVGFNVNYSMNGTDVHACQLTPDNEKVVVKKGHNANSTNYPDNPDNIGFGLTNTAGAYANEHISCSFTRSVKPIANDPTSMDLSQPHTFIFALNVNGTAAATMPLEHKHNHYEPLALPAQHTALERTFNYNATQVEKRHQRRHPSRPIAVDVV